LGAQNEWDALNRLQALQIPSLIPLAYGKRGTNPARQESFIVTRELEGVVQLDHYFERQSPSVQQKRAIIQRLAELARDFHGAGINHRDFYLCHFMLNPLSLSTLPAGKIAPQLYLMDLHRAQCRAQVPMRWLVKDLGGLFFSCLNLSFNRRDIYRFMRVYFGQSLRELLVEHSLLLKQTKQRAVRTYTRDFGHAPKLF
jgi:UDP-glucose:(heptosyl)LPS alpha-1,3-glucosyltransferase